MGMVAAPAASAAKSEAPVEHVWVHYDYMVGSDHSHAPSEAAIDMVVQAFKNHGVILHVDSKHSEIPEHKVIVFDGVGAPFVSDDPNCTGPDAVRFSALKAQYFDPPSNHPWRYAIFGHQVDTDSLTHASNCPTGLGGHYPDPSSSGMAELPGDDFVIATGFFSDQGSNSYCFTDLTTGEPLPCWPLQDWAGAAFFMHELGHTLGLHHGGNDDRNDKPNYISVMNYQYVPIFTSTVQFQGQAISSGVRVDYSDEALPDLYEAHLDETVGLQSQLHPTDVARWWVPGPTVRQGLASGPIDWNGDGDANDTTVGLDLNNDGNGGQVDSGFNDWAFIHESLAKKDG